jgi:hypothetical protein
MKQTTQLTAALFAVVVGLIGCASIPLSTPEWFLHPPHDTDYIYDMGVAQGSNEEVAWKAAAEDSRANLATQISVSIKAMQTDYSKASGVSGGDAFFSTITVQLTDLVLRGATIVKRGVGPGNTYYVLTSYPQANMKRAIANSIQAESAGTPGFQPESALKSMDSAVKIWSAPAPTTPKAKPKPKWDEFWEDSKEYAIRNYVNTSFFIQWDDDGGVGFDWQMLGIHWSFLPFTSLGFAYVPGVLTGNPLYGAFVYAGFVLPLITSSDPHIALFADGLLEMGDLAPRGLMTDRITPGFESGIAFTWDWIGFDIKYRGIWRTEGRYIHSIGAGLIWDIGDW